MQKYHIYCINNSANKKVYIGCTKQPIEMRWACHKSYARNDWGYSKLYTAMREIGIDKFDIVEIDRVSTIREMYQKEQEYIKQFDSIENGYNTHSFHSTGDDPYEETDATLKTLRTELKEKQEDAERHTENNFWTGLFLILISTATFFV